MALGYAGVALAVLAWLSLRCWPGKAESTILRRVTGERWSSGAGGGVSLWYCCDCVQFLIAAGLLPEVGWSDSLNSLLGARINADTQFDLLMQAHCLNFLPLPHGQGSLRPGFSLLWSVAEQLFPADAPSSTHEIKRRQSNGIYALFKRFWRHFSTRSKFSSVPCSAIASSAGLTNRATLTSQKVPRPAYSQTPLLNNRQLAAINFSQAE